MRSRTETLENSSSEVHKALNKTRGLYLRWLEVGETPNVPESEWTTTELRNALRSIEWDLEDLEDTISIVERNPSRFRIDLDELTDRKGFIAATRQEVKDMKEKMDASKNRDRDRTARQPLLDGSVVAPPRHSTTKYSKLKNQIDSPSHYDDKFISETNVIQQQMLDNQEDQLHMINNSVDSLKTVSRQIGIEIEEQAVMLDDFNGEIENTESKLDSTMKRVSKILHLSNDRRQWIAIGVLTIILIIMVILFLLK